MTLNKEGNDEEKLHLTNAKTNHKFEAYVFVARNALKNLINDDNGNKLLTEMLFFEWDTRIYNAKKKVVQNKNARYNLNFDDKHQIADFKIGNGTTIS